MPLPAPGLFIEPAASRPDDIAIESPDGQRTWGDLELATRRVANGMAALGLAAGDRIAVLSRNRPEFIEVVLGSARAGTRFVPLNWHLTPDEIAYILEDSGARVLVCDPRNEDTAREAAGRTAARAWLMARSNRSCWL